MPPEPVVVVQVESGSWADKVALKPGDQLQSLDNRLVGECDQKDFVACMHNRPLSLTFHRKAVEDQRRSSSASRGSVSRSRSSTSSRASTPLRASVVERLNSEEEVRPSIVVRQNATLGSISRTSQVLASFPTWEDYSGELHIKATWAWKRRFFQLSKGHLKWWRDKDTHSRTPRPEPEGDISLVETSARWKVEALKGTRFELAYHKNADKLKEEEEARRKAQEKQMSAHKRKSVSAFLVRSNSKSEKKVDRYVIAADDISSATDWARAIWHQMAYIDMLLIWPMPLEGRQGEVSFYGIDAPES